MVNSVYQINKGVNKSIEFKGLKAQYIWYMGGGILLLLIFYAAMYVVGINTFLCIGIILTLGSFLILKIYGMSNRYGEHGLMKAIAKRSVPKLIKINSRKVFRQIDNIKVREKRLSDIARRETHLL